MSERVVGPLQLIMVGFETTERFTGEIAREVAALRGRGTLRVLDARLLHRTPAGELTAIDLNPTFADPPPQSNPVAHLFGLNGGGNGAKAPAEAYQRAAGFAVEDLRRLSDEIGPGQYVGAVLVEHVWAADLREAILRAGGRLLAQGFLTPEVIMIAGAEIRARADAEAAIELAEAARGAALLDALGALARGSATSIEDRTRAAAEVVRVLVAKGFVRGSEAARAVDAVATAGLIERATLQALVAEAEELLEHPDEPDDR